MISYTRESMAGERTTEDVLGFCTACFRVRWLAVIESHDRRGNPQGTCRSCDREEQEAAT